MRVYTGDLDLPTQSAVNAFHYTEVTGNLTIGNSVSPEEIKDLSALSTLTRVGGNLILHGNEALANIDGLNALRSVGGDLEFLNNPGLGNVDGLSALTEIGGELYFFKSYSLRNLNGLSSLTTVGGSVGFAYGTHVGPGATALTTIGGYLTLVEVRVDGSDGLFPKLTTIGGGLGIYQAIGLRNLDGFSALTSVGAGVFLREDVELENINGLSSLTTVGGGLLLVYLPKLADLNGLSALTSVGGDVTIQFNSLLENYCDLWGLLSAGGPGGEVNIAFNAANPTVEEIIAAGPCVIDTDGDGVPDDHDNCASSDLRPTVWILNCDSGVLNRADGNGCSVADRVAAIIAQSATDARNHGQFVSRTARALNVLVSDGLISQAEHQSLMGCVGSCRPQ